jgi:hypothetical protein
MLASSGDIIRSAEKEEEICTFFGWYEACTPAGVRRRSVEMTSGDKLKGMKGID